MRRASNLERQLTTWVRRGKQVFHQNFFQPRETPFDKKNSFGISYAVIEELEVLWDLDKTWFVTQLCERGTLRDADTTIWVPIQQARSNFLISFIQFDWRTNFSMQVQSKKFGRVFCWCSLWVSNTEQNSDETAVVVFWDQCFEQTLSCILHTCWTTPSHATTDGSCWFAGSLGKTLQQSLSLWLQQRSFWQKIWRPFYCLSSLTKEGSYQ